MTQFLNLIDEQETTDKTEFNKNKFPPSLNKYMNMINEYDSSIYRVAFIIDGDTVSKSKFSFTALVKDVIDLREDGTKRKSILDDLTAYAETCETNYDLTRIAMSDKMKQQLKNGFYTVLNVDMDEQEFVKNGKTIAYHNWNSYNKRKNSLNH